MEAERYQDFSLRVHEQVLAGRVPVNGTIEISRRCPLECAHCYNNLPMHDQAARQAELSFAEHCRILDEISAAGCFWLLFTGGEIFARRDFLEIYSYAKRLGFIITLFTNGTMITPEIADYLVKWRPFSIEITLYGRTAETYERLTGIPGSYQKCIRGIQLLKERNLPLKVKTVGVTINKHELGQMKQFAEEELGVPFSFDSMINPRIDCSQAPLAVRLSPREIVELDLLDADRMTEWQRVGEQLCGPVHSSEQQDQLYHCGGGINSFAIDPYGKLSICVLSHQQSYDLRQGSFQAGWDGFLRQVRSRKITLATKCVACEIKSLCGMCPANGELESGHAEKPVDFLCQVAHLRAQAFGYPIKPHGDCEYCPSGTGYAELKEIAATIQPWPASGRTKALPIVKSPSADLGGCGSGCSSCSSQQR